MAPRPETHGHAPRHARAPAEFIRGIGPLAAISLVVGSMIGSGIFIVSADIARQVRQWGPGALLLVWFVTGAMTVTGALAYAELAAMMPQRRRAVRVPARRALAARRASSTAGRCSP